MSASSSFHVPFRPLPAEVGLLVIDNVGSEGEIVYEHKDAEYLRTLSNCALVCKEWLPGSRRYLFRTIYVQSRRGLGSLRTAFQAKLSPRDFVTALVVSGDASSISFHDVLRFMYETSFPFLGTLHTTHSAFITYNDPGTRLNNVTRKFLAMRYLTITKLTIRHTTGHRAAHLLKAFPNLRSFVCDSIVNDWSKTIPPFVPSCLRLSCFQVGPPLSYQRASNAAVFK